MVPVGNYEHVMPLDILATQLLRALVVGDIASGQLRQWLQDKLRPQEIPGHFYFADKLPRNEMGKASSWLQ